MAKEESVEAQGTVLEATRNAFIVKLDNSEHKVYCIVAGKMRKFFIRVVPGDHVTVAMSPYDLTRGRITFRDK